MGLPPQLSPLLCSALFFFMVFVSFPSAITADDPTNLVYKGCANQNFQDPTGVYSQNLKSLLDSLVSQSSLKTYFSTTSGEGQKAISGVFQCRGDLTTSQCNTCVKKIQPLVTKLCGEVIAARVQLSGCYLRYEVSGFKQVPETEFLYKICGSDQAAGFEEKRDSAFEMLENGMKNNGSGGLFFAGNYQSMYVLGQCEGDLATGDCVDCVKKADERARSECGNSISGRIYLQKCYINYNFYPNGVPSLTSSPGSGPQHTQKIVAIVLGGLFAFGCVIVCWLFVRSLVKKHGRKHGNF